jgi:hypothetical protein
MEEVLFIGNGLCNQVDVFTAFISSQLYMYEEIAIPGSLLLSNMH